MEGGESREGRSETGDEMRLCGGGEWAGLSGLYFMEEETEGVRPADRGGAGV